jgi:hypothetical protein
MTPHEETRIAQMVDGYDRKIGELEDKLHNIFMLCGDEVFEAETCPEAHLQNILCEIQGIAKDNYNLAGYERKIGELEEKLHNIFVLCGDEVFEAETCPEAHLQNILCEIRGIAKDNYNLAGTLPNPNGRP